MNHIQYLLKNNNDAHTVFLKKLVVYLLKNNNEAHTVFNKK